MAWQANWRLALKRRNSGGGQKSMPTASLGRACLLTYLIAFAISATGTLVAPSRAFAQSETRERQAAAEAYDQGTASYLSGDFARAAEWFETAHRLSPAAPAL